MNSIKREIVLKLIDVDNPLYFSYLLIVMELGKYFRNSRPTYNTTVLATIQINEFYMKPNVPENETEYAKRVIKYIIDINDPEYTSSAKRVMDKIIENKSFWIDHKKFYFTNEDRSAILVQYISKSYPSPDWRITPSI